MPLLVEKLLAYYPPTHPIYLYEAAVLPGCEPTIVNATIATLGSYADVGGIYGLYPAGAAHLSDPAIVGRMQQLAAMRAPERRERSISPRAQIA